MASATSNSQLSDWCDQIAGELRELIGDDENCPKSIELTVKLGQELFSDLQQGASFSRVQDSISNFWEQLQIMPGNYGNLYDLLRTGLPDSQGDQEATREVILYLSPEGRLASLIEFGIIKVVADLDLHEGTDATIYPKFMLSSGSDKPLNDGVFASIE
jgi:hypothetical protein